MDMVAAIVGALDKRELFQSMTTYAGRRHARFGAKPLHFIAFGHALIWCLEQQLGEPFTPELRQAAFSRALSAIGAGALPTTAFVG